MGAEEVGSSRQKAGISLTRKLVRDHTCTKSSILGRRAKVRWRKRKEHARANHAFESEIDI